MTNDRAAMHIRLLNLIVRNSFIPFFSTGVVVTLALVLVFDWKLGGVLRVTVAFCMGAIVITLFCGTLLRLFFKEAWAQIRRTRFDLKNAEELSQEKASVLWALTIQMFGISSMALGYGFLLPSMLLLAIRTAGL